MGQGALVLHQCNPSPVRDRFPDPPNRGRAAPRVFPVFCILQT